MNPLRATFTRHWRALVGFAILFRLVESLLFSPAAALAGQFLLGRTVLDSTALVAFLLSPRGFLALTLAAVTALSIRLLEHAGLSIIFFADFQGAKVSARKALRLVRQHLLTLVRVAVRFFLLGLVAALPFLLVLGGFAAWLLPRHDINYYLKLRPPEFTLAATIILIAGVVTGAGLLWLLVRWRWAVQVVLFENHHPAAAFRRSAELSRGQRGRLALALLAVTAFSLGLGLLASVLGKGSASIVLALSGEGVVWLALSFGALLLLRTAIAAACTFLGSCLDAGLFTSLYRQRVEQLGGHASLAVAEEPDATPRARALPLLLALGIVVGSLAGAWFAFDALTDERSITIHAHRGVTERAPENTLSAFRDAIAAGADYLETDVQLSKDGVLVLVHDSDFSRLGGVAGKVWDLTYEEIRSIPLGRHSAAEYRNEPTPTLDDLLAEAKGRAKLNLELKYYGGQPPGLAAKVVETLRARGMLDQVVIQCLEYAPLQEVQQLAPEIPVGYLLSFNAREPDRLNVHFLSAEKSRVDRLFLLAAHQRGQRVLAWTVNRREEMERLLDAGVDGLITDQPALARETVDHYLSLPKVERAARRVRAWLAE